MKPIMEPLRLTSLQLSLSELLNYIAHHLMNECGHHGIVSVTVDERLGLALGIVPGHEATFNVSTGPIIVRSAGSM